MADQRSQGRPRSDERQFGREKLLEKTRLAMGRPPRAELQRRDIADIAGITPALINYYFPDKWAMLEEASLPIIKAYTSKVADIIDSDNDERSSFRRLIDLYIAFNEENGYLLEYYIEASSQLGKTESINLLWNTHAKIIDYFYKCIGKKIIKNTNPELLNAVCWSICKYVAQQSEERKTVIFTGIDNSKSSNIRSEVVFDLLFNGFALK